MAVAVCPGSGQGRQAGALDHPLGPACCAALQEEGLPCPALPCPAWNPQSLHLFDPAYHCVHCCWYLSQVASALKTLYKPIVGCVRATSAFSALFCLLFFEALLSMLQSIAVAWLACGLETEVDRSFLPLSHTFALGSRAQPCSSKMLSNRVAAEWLLCGTQVRHLSDQCPYCVSFTI